MGGGLLECLLVLGTWGFCCAFPPDFAEFYKDCIPCLGFLIPNISLVSSAACYYPSLEFGIPRFCLRILGSGLHLYMIRWISPLLMLVWETRVGFSPSDASILMLFFPFGIRACLQIKDLLASLSPLSLLFYRDIPSPPLSASTEWMRQSAAFVLRFDFACGQLVESPPSHLFGFDSG